MLPPTSPTVVPNSLGYFACYWWRQVGRSRCLPGNQELCQGAGRNWAEEANLRGEVRVEQEAGMMFYKRIPFRHQRTCWVILGWKRVLRDTSLRNGPWTIKFFCQDTLYAYLYPCLQSLSVASNPQSTMGKPAVGIIDELRKSLRTYPDIYLVYTHSFVD